jgi:hypothetical protein
LVWELKTNLQVASRFGGQQFGRSVIVSNDALIVELGGTVDSRHACVDFEKFVLREPLFRIIIRPSPGVE